MLWNYTELQTKTNRKPIHGVKIEELNELKDSMGSFIFTCKIQDKYANDVRSIYRETWEVEKFPGGTKMSDTIILFIK